MASPQVHPSAASSYRPDLLAKALSITAYHATKKVHVAALIQNIGTGNVSGPFEISVSVDLTRGGTLTSFVQVFEVPASVTLAAQPVFEQALARGPIGINNWFETQYLTDPMEVPLYFLDDTPSAHYNAEFLVDSANQVSESNESNNYYACQTVFGL